MSSRHSGINVTLTEVEASHPGSHDRASALRNDLPEHVARAGADADSIMTRLTSTAALRIDRDDMQSDEVQELEPDGFSAMSFESLGRDCRWRLQRGC